MLGLFNKRKIPDLQPMLIRKDELKDSIVAAYKEIKCLETEEQKEALKKDGLTESMRNTMSTFFAMAIFWGIVIVVSCVMVIVDKWGKVDLLNIMTLILIAISLVMLIISFIINMKAVKKEINREFLAAFSSFFVSFTALIVALVALFK